MSKWEKYLAPWSLVSSSLKVGMACLVFLYVLVGFCHVQTCPNVFSVFLWCKGNVVAPFCGFVPYIFNDTNFLPFVENLIKFVFERQGYSSLFLHRAFASGFTCNFLLIPFNLLTLRTHPCTLQLGRLSLANSSPWLAVACLRSSPGGTLRDPYVQRPHGVVVQCHLDL